MHSNNAGGSLFSNSVKEWQRGRYDRAYWAIKASRPSPGAPSKGILKACRKNPYCRAFSTEVKEEEALHAILGRTVILRSPLQFFAWQRMVQEFGRQSSPASGPKITRKNRVAFITACGDGEPAFLAISPDGMRLFADRGLGSSIVQEIIRKTDAEFKQFDMLLNQ